MTADALMVDVHANINHSERQSAITSTACLIPKRPTQVVRTRLEREFGQERDQDDSQKQRIITTSAAAVMVSFPMSVLNAPRRIGSTPIGWFFGVGRAEAQRGRRRCSRRLAEGSPTPSV